MLGSVEADILFVQSWQVWPLFMSERMFVFPLFGLVLLSTGDTLASSLCLIVDTKLLLVLFLGRCTSKIEGGVQRSICN